MHLKRTRDSGKRPVIGLSGPLQTTLEEFENRGFTLPRREMFLFTLRRRNLKRNNQWSFWINILYSRKTRLEMSHDYRRYTVIEKFRFSKCFLSTGKRKSGVSNSFSLKSFFIKLRFCDGLMWMAGLTGEIKLRF